MSDVSDMVLLSKLLPESVDMTLQENILKYMIVLMHSVTTFVDLAQNTDMKTLNMIDADDFEAGCKPHSIPKVEKTVVELYIIEYKKRISDCWKKFGREVNDSVLTTFEDMVRNSDTTLRRDARYPCTAGS